LQGEVCSLSGGHQSLCLHDLDAGSAVYKTEDACSQSLILQQLARLMKGGLASGFASICEDAELRELVAAWSAMPAAVRAGIVALIRAGMADTAE
jgi:hypothetical protein